MCIRDRYNGDSFDQPYLDARYQIHGLSSPFTELPSLDLYRELKPLKGLLKLSRMNQPSMESFLGITERNYYDGGACIRLYKQFASGKKPEAAEIVMGHNQEDLLGLGKIFSMLSYLALFSFCFLRAGVSITGGGSVARRKRARGNVRR